jgi:hypothetical protein
VFEEHTHAAADVKDMACPPERSGLDDPFGFGLYLRRNRLQENAVVVFEIAALIIEMLAAAFV